MKQRRRWWLASAAGVVAAVSLLMVPALGDGPVIEELGVLRLHLDTDGDRVTFVPAAGSNQTQTLTAPNCKLTSTGPRWSDSPRQQRKPTRTRSPV